MKPYAGRLQSKDYSVESISYRSAYDFVEEFHYAKGMSNTCVFAHGLFDDLGALVGVAVWLCPTQRVCKTVDPDSWKRVISLSRLAIHPNVPKNACSFLMSRSIALIRKDGRYRSLVSYADTARGHTGLIYRASGWSYMGMTVATPLWIDPISGKMHGIKATRTRTVDEMRAKGFEFKGRFPKHKFVRYLDRQLHRRFCEL